MAGQRLIVERFANITDGSVTSIQAPGLLVGGDTQFDMMDLTGPTHYITRYGLLLYSCFVFFLSPSDPSPVPGREWWQLSHSKSFYVGDSYQLSSDYW